MNDARIGAEIVRRKVAKTRAAFLAESDSAEKRRLERKLKKLKRRAAARPTAAEVSSIPQEAFQLRHMWHR